MLRRDALLLFRAKGLTPKALSLSLTTKDTKNSSVTHDELRVTSVVRVGANRRRCLQPSVCDDCVACTSGIISASGIENHDGLAVGGDQTLLFEHLQDTTGHFA